MNTVVWRARRALAGILTATVAVGISLAGAASAQAVTDGEVSFEWTGATLLTDVNGNGRPDPGDEMKYTYSSHQPSSDPEGWPSLARAFMDMGPAFFASHTFATGLGEAHFTVRAEDLGVGRSGPHLKDAVWSYTGSDSQPATLLLPAPPVFYAPPVVTVETVVEEAYGDTADGKPAQGDVVRLSLVLPAGAVATGASTTLPDGRVRVAAGSAVVTYDDMVAGSVTVTSAEVAYTFDGRAWAYPSDEVRVDTEAIVRSIDVSLGFTSSGAVTVGDGVTTTQAIVNNGNISVGNFAYVIADHERTLTSGALVGTISPGTVLPMNVPQRTVTDADVARGYVTYTLTVTPSVPGSPDAVQGEASAHLVLRDLVSPVDMLASASLNDTNGDGIGQTGETIDVAWAATLDASAEQSVETTLLRESGAAAGGLVAGTLAPGESIGGTATVTITDAMVEAGAFDYAATLSSSGAIDGVQNDSGDAAATVPLGPYVAPATSADVAHMLTDTDGSGGASIGDTVTFTATVTNDGDYPLTGLTLAESWTSGQLPSRALLAPGDTLTWTAEHVVTAADYADSHVRYAIDVVADGLTSLGASDTVTGIEFAAFETDLDGVVAGGVTVCRMGEPITEAAPGDAITVGLDSCDDAPASGARILMFSTPVELGVGTSEVTIPADAADGPHRIAVYGADGILVGWAGLAVAAPAAVTPVNPTPSLPQEPTPNTSPSAVPTADELADAGLAASGPRGAAWLLACALLTLGVGAAVVVRSRNRA